MNNPDRFHNPIIKLHTILSTANPITNLVKNDQIAIKMNQNECVCPKKTGKSSGVHNTNVLFRSAENCRCQ